MEEEKGSEVVVGPRLQKPLKPWPCIEDNMMAEVKNVLCTTAKKRQNYLSWAKKLGLGKYGLAAVATETSRLEDAGKYAGTIGT